MNSFMCLHQEMDVRKLQYKHVAMVPTSLLCKCRTTACVCCFFKMMRVNSPAFLEVVILAFRTCLLGLVPSWQNTYIKNEQQAVDEFACLPTLAGGNAFAENY